MTSIDRHVPEFLALVGEFEQRFQSTESAAANGPHAALSLQELRLVEFLGGGGRRIMKDLAARLHLAVNSVTSVVDNLEAKGVVVRQRSAADRRVIHVELTDAGRAAFAAIVGEKVATARWLLQGLAAAERDTFMQLFRKMARVEAPPAKK